METNQTDQEPNETELGTTDATYAGDAEKGAEEPKDAPKSDDSGEDFNLIQRWAFPVYLRELPKVVPVVLLLAVALFIYTAYRDVKDAIVFAEEGQSLITVQYCKVVVMVTALPAAAVFLKLDNMVSRDFIFFQTVLTFGMYFLLNGLCFYPFKDAVHQFGSEAIRDVRFNNDDDTCNRLLPLIGAFVFPVNTVSFILSELWGTISVSFLVWGYVNLVTPKQAAKRYYAVLGIGGQFGSMLGALLVSALNSNKKMSFTYRILILNCIMFAMSCIFAGIYAYLQYYVMKKPQYAVKSGGGKKKGKPKMSVMQAMKYCLSNGYVLALCGMVFAYGFVMVLGELTYKEVMKLNFDGNPGDYSKFKGMESSITSAVAVFLMIFVGHNVIRIFGWLAAALLTPAICAVTGVLLYVLSLSGNFYDYDKPSNSYSKKEGSEGYLEMLTYIGLTFAVASKAMKYSSFDPAKELAFLALNSEQKYKAKAAVDIVGARFGKGGGAMFNILVLSIAIGSKVSYTKPCLAASFAGVAVGLVIWFVSDLYIFRRKDAVAAETQREAARKADAPDSVQIEGVGMSVKDLKNTGLHIEMSTAPDASFTVGGSTYATPLPSRGNTPEA